MSADLEIIDLVELVEALARDIASQRGLSLRDPTYVPPGRVPVLRLWIARDDPRQIWIRGRVVVAKVADVTYEAPFDVHLAEGFPKAIVDAFDASVIDKVRESVTQLATLPCLCHTGTEYIEEHDTLEVLVSRNDPNEPRTSVTVGYCTVCKTGWTFGRNDERRFGESAAVRGFVPMLNEESSDTTLTILVVPANHPDDIDAMSFARRRTESAGWTKLDVFHHGEPDVLVRIALDIDQGVYAAPRDHDDGWAVETSLITADHLEYAAGLLTPHMADPLALAQILVEESGSGEDHERVARALAEELPGRARGPAEEAASWVRVFLAYVPEALRWGMGIAWEYRTREPRKEPEAARAAETVPAVLPTFAPFVAEVASAVAGEVITFRSASPVAAIRIDGAHCLVMVREREGAFHLSLPLAGSWRVQTHAEWMEVKSALPVALAGHPRMVSLADVMTYLSLQSTVERIAERAVPRAVSLRRGDSAIELSQNADSVTLSVAGRQRVIDKLAALEGLVDWIDEAVR